MGAELVVERASLKVMPCRRWHVSEGLHAGPAQLLCPGSSEVLSHPESPQPWASLAKTPSPQVSTELGPATLKPPRVQEALVRGGSGGGDAD